MGINYHKKVVIGEKTFKLCKQCQLAYDETSNFCSECGTKLTKKSTKIYANFGKTGITSLSYKTPDGITINSKGNTTIPIGVGISYTINKNKKKK